MFVEELTKDYFIESKYDFDKIKSPNIFTIIQKEGQIGTDEMFRVFNMGIGMCVISSEEIPESEDLVKIGHIS